MTSFSDLLRLHRDLDDFFLEHHRALLRLNLERASEVLDRYERDLLAHIGDEENFMMPLYRQRANAPTGGAPEIFEGEHEKLRQFLMLFRAELEKLKWVDDLERGILFLIDSQHLFKRLLVHHDTREKKFLYPLLDEVTTEVERQSILEKLELQPIRRNVAA